MRLGGLGIFLLLDQVDPVVHFANSAPVLHEATLVTYILCGKAPPLTSCIPLSQYKSQAVCCRGRLRVIVFDKNCNPILLRELQIAPIYCILVSFPSILYTAILGLSRSYWTSSRSSSAYVGVYGCEEH